MFNKKLKKLLRTARIYLPGTGDLKYQIQKTYHDTRKTPFDYTFNLLKDFIPDTKRVFVDVGANKGQSIAAMRLFHPGIAIVAFEPRSATFQALQRYTAYFEQLELVHGGLGDRPGQFELYTPVYRGHVFDGLASTIPHEAEEWLSSNRLYFFDKSKLSIQREDVALRALDSYNLCPSFLKLDVQGAEESVLRGGLDTIAAHKPLIMVEQSPQTDLEGLLSPFGYAAYHYDGSALRLGASGRRNAFLVPEARKADLTLPIE
jgi:FkbM family methyltransferase